MNTDGVQKTGRGRLEAWIVFLAAATVCLLVGLRVWREGGAEWDAIAALSHAFDVVHKEPRFNLGLIGFVDPPLPALLYLPFCGFLPKLASSGLACPLLGALMLGGTAVLLNGIASRAGLRGIWRWVLVAALVVHPLVLGQAILGAQGIVLCFALLGAAGALMRWAQSDNFRDLLTCSLFLTAALLTRYEIIWIALTATAYVAWRTHRKGDGWSRTEGTLIAFLLPVAYSACVWIGSNWAIMGDPWHFWRETLAQPSAAAVPYSDRISIVLWLAVAACPLILGLLYHEVRGVGQRSPAGRPAAWLVVGAGIGAAVSPGMHATSGSDALSALLALRVASAAMGYALLAVVIGGYVGRSLKEARRPLGGTVMLAVLGVWIAVAYGPAGLPLTPRGAISALAGQVTFRADVQPEKSVAQALCDNLQPDRKAYVMGANDFAVSLFTGKPDCTLLGEAAPGRLPLEAGDVLATDDAAQIAGLAPLLNSKCLTLEQISSGQTGNWLAYRVGRAKAPK